ncbi:TPA: ead/Ea22-like family protein [Klebsiella quasipneumoniae subsp. quasipneumoniae]|nr:ead/Ea22-like family protein [Klebsiella quasipneumoniae subsp. quasipneumoniae]
MTDITELAQSLKAAAENAGADYWQAKKISGDFYVIRKGSYKRECGYVTYQPIAEIDHKPTRDYMAMASPANILALVESLENSESRLHEVAVACATAEQALEKAQQRIAELESRTVTVKLPESFKLAKSSSGLTYYYADEVDAALAAAGIKVEVE